MLTLDCAGLMISEEEILQFRRDNPQRHAYKIDGYP